MNLLNVLSLFGSKTSVGREEASGTSQQAATDAGSAPFAGLLARIASAAAVHATSASPADASSVRLPTTAVTGATAPPVVLPYAVESGGARLPLEVQESGESLPIRTFDVGTEEDADIAADGAAAGDTTDASDAGSDLSIGTPPMHGTTDAAREPALPTESVPGRIVPATTSSDAASIHGAVVNEPSAMPPAGRTATVRDAVSPPIDIDAVPRMPQVGERAVGAIAAGPTPVAADDVDTAPQVRVAQSPDTPAIVHPSQSVLEGDEERPLRSPVGTLAARAPQEGASERTVRTTATTPAVATVRAASPAAPSVAPAAMAEHTTPASVPMPSPVAIGLGDVPAASTHVAQLQAPAHTPSAATEETTNVTRDRAPLMAVDPSAEELETMVPVRTTSVVPPGTSMRLERGVVFESLAEPDVVDADGVIEHDDRRRSPLPSIGDRVLLKSNGTPAVAQTAATDDAPAEARIEPTVVKTEAAVARPQEAAAQTAAPRTPVLPFVPNQLMRFTQDLTDQVVQLRTHRLDRATISLDPADLGRVEIRLRMDSDTTHVAFVVQNAGVRDALEAQLPRLRSMLEASGLALGDVDVDQSGTEDNTGPEPWRNRERLHRSHTGAVATAAANASPRDRQRVEGAIIDVHA